MVTATNVAKMANKKGWKEKLGGKWQLPKHVLSTS